MIEAEPTVELLTPSDVENDPSLWVLYDAAFPAEERDPRAVIEKGVALQMVDVVRARLGDSTVGFAVVHRLLERPIGFLVYLAVIPETRGRGVGRRLFRHVENACSDGVVWEIDDPARASDATERLVRERRKGFFERLGGQVVSASYFQPPINGPEPVAMLLMASGRAQGFPAGELVRAIYSEKYIALNGLDAGLVHALRDSRQ